MSRRANRAQGLAAWGMLCWLMSAAVTMPAAAQQAGQSSDAARLKYTRAVRVHNKGAFEVAAEEWSDFLKQHPDDPLAAKARFYLAICHQQTQQLEKAAAEFAEVLKDPKFELAEEARFHLGWVQYSMAQGGQDKLYADAAATFAKVVAGQGKRVDEALYFQGESLYAQGKKDEAVQLYARVVKEHPKSKHFCDALYAGGVALEELGRHAEAGQVYDRFMTQCSDSELLTEVRMRKAETVLQAGQVAEAEAMFGAVAAAEGFALADHAMFRQADCRFKLNQFAAAGQLYAQLIEKFPQSDYRNDAAMAAGRCFYRAKDHPQAARWLQQVIEAGGADAPEAGHWLCQIHLAARRPAEAAALAARLLPQAGDSSFLPHLKLDQADATHADPKQRAEAIKQYLALAAEHPQSGVAPQALYYAAFGLMELQQYDAALQETEKFLKDHADDQLAADVQYVAAESQLNLKQYAAAEKAFQKLIETYPQHAERELWRLRHATTLYVQKKYDAAVAALQQALPEIKSPDGLAEAHFLIGASQFYQGQFEQAASALQASQKAAPQWTRADETLLLLARSQQKLNRLDDALATVQQMIAEFPDSGLLDQAHYRQAEFFYAQQDYEAAVEQYDLCLKAAADSPYAPYALYGKGWSLLKTGQPAEAEAALTSLISDFASHALAVDAYLARATARRQAGKHEQVLADVAQYLKSEPPADKACDALYEQGLSQVALKQLAPAATTFADILQRKPDYANAASVLYELAWARKSLGQEAEAVQAFAQLADEHADSQLAAEACYHVAESLYDQKKYAEASARYIQARDKAAGNKQLREKAVYKLGWSYFQQKDYGRAHQQFADQAANHADGPLAGDAAFLQAETLFLQDKDAEALPLFQAARQLKLPERLEVLALLHGGQCAAQQKQWKTSLEFLAEVPQKFPQSPHLPVAYYERGWAQQNLGQQEAALKDYRQAAELGRGEVAARARFMAGELLFAQQHFDEAVKEFQRVMFFFGDDAPAEVKNWQAKAGYEAGRCADVQIKDETDAARRARHIADAKKFYTYVTQNHPKHELAAQAQKRLQQLGTL